VVLRLHNYIAYKDPRPSTIHQLPSITFEHNTATIASSIFNSLKVATRTFFTGPNISPAAMSAAKQKAQQIIAQNGVVVFSKSYCPYCRASKALLNEKHAKYFLMELDEVGMCY